MCAWDTIFCFLRPRGFDIFTTITHSYIDAFSCICYCAEGYTESAWTKRKESGYFGRGYFRDRFTQYAKEKYDMPNRQFQLGFGTHGFIFLCVIGNFTLGIYTNAHLICSSVTVICETTSLIKQKNMFDHNGG